VRAADTCRISTWWLTDIVVEVMSLTPLETPTEPRPTPGIRQAITDVSGTEDVRELPTINRNHGDYTEHPKAFKETTVERIGLLDLETNEMDPCPETM
jgi:hypothetical protein